MFENVINSKKQGDIGMCYAIAYYSKMGYTISIPITDSQDYDLIVETSDKEIKKVQVKTTYCKTKYGIYTVSLRTTGGNKSGNTSKKMNKDYIDWLFILTDSGDTYNIPTSSINGTGSINLGDNYQEYKVFLI